MDADQVEFGAAVGLFNGEGCVTSKVGDRNCAALVVQMSQARSPEVLERFQSAMGGRGRINGPYPRKERRQSVWEYRCTRYEDALWIIKAMWPWLSQQKRSQAQFHTDRVQEVKDRPRLSKGRSGRKPWRKKDKCLRGHDLTLVPENTKGKRPCPECATTVAHNNYMANRERRYAQQLAWRENNPDKVREYNQRQRAKVWQRENVSGADNQQGRPSS